MNASDTSKIERYSKAMQIALAEDIADRKKIFLDVKFWIFARDAMLGKNKNPLCQELLELLSCGVTKGTFICPISLSIFQEILKQAPKPEKRIAIAALIDDLSLGVTIIQPQLLIGTEIHRWLLLLKGKQETYTMQELVWTKVSCIYGDIYPTWPDLSLQSEEEFKLQKSFFNKMWEQSLSQMVDALIDAPIPANDFRYLSNEINRQNKSYADELTSLKVACDIELRGVIEHVAGMVVESLREIVEEADGWPITSSSDNQIKMENAAKNLLYEGFKNGSAQKDIRSLYIIAMIHAARRRDTIRKFEPNDFHDFNHATAALAYCDAFFTEKSLHDLVSRKDLGLEDINGCRTFSNMETAINYLRSIL